MKTITLPKMTNVWLMPIWSATKPVLTKPIIAGSNAMLKYIENTRPSIEECTCSCKIVVKLAL